MNGSEYTYQVEASDNGDIWVIDGNPNDPPGYLPESELSAVDVALEVLTRRTAEGFADNWSDTPHTHLRVVVWMGAPSVNDGDEDAACAVATIHNLTTAADAARREQ